MRGLSAGDRLKKFRKLKKWSQGDLATHLGTSQQFVAQMEAGKRPLTKEASSLILLPAIPTYEQPQFACETDIDSNKDTDTKNGLGDHEKES